MSERIKISERPPELEELLAEFGVGSVKELYLGPYRDEDQRLMRSGEWDYEDPTLLTNRFKKVLEALHLSDLTDEDARWRDELLWFWNHHAVSSAIWRHKDKAAAKKYADIALSHKGSEHPNRITQLLKFLSEDQSENAERWVGMLQKDAELAQKVLETEDKIKFPIPQDATFHIRHLLELFRRDPEEARSWAQGMIVEAETGIELLGGHKKDGG